MKLSHQEIAYVFTHWESQTLAEMAEHLACEVSDVEACFITRGIAHAEIRLPVGRSCNGHARLVEAFGETKTIAQWLLDPRCVISESTLYVRLNNGWPAELAISSPRQKAGRPRNANG